MALVSSTEGGRPMQRRRALALAGASTLVLGSGVVGSAAVGGSFLGFGGGARDDTGSLTAPVVASASKPHVSMRLRDVYDRYVVDVGGAPGGASKGAATLSSTPAVIAAPLGPAPTTVPAVAPDTSGGGGAARPTPTSVDDAPSRPPPTPTTNVTPKRPRGVPEDWPAGKPVPPMPPNCHEPQLEDNGVWNCQQANHD
jgi:hypothetical protein